MTNNQKLLNNNHNNKGDNVNNDVEPESIDFTTEQATADCQTPTYVSGEYQY